jgi:Spy/CpxP family protein refolding chaperone
MRISILRFAIAMLVWSATGSVAGAQVARPNRDLRGRGARGQLGDSAAPAEQQALVRRVRQAFSGVVRRQLNLNDEKWTQFERVDRRFQQQRNQIQRDERETRFALKAAMQDTANVDQTKIAQYLTELTQAQRRRADLLDAEQKELSAFLTPLQRAKLQGLREQLNRRVLQLQQQAPPGGRRGKPFAR